MGLKTYVSAIVKHKWTVGVFVLGCVFLGLISIWRTTPEYQASATVMLKDLPALEDPFPKPVPLLTPTPGDLIRILTSRDIAFAVARRYKQADNIESASVNAVQQSITAASIPGTYMVVIRVRSTDPTRARDMANYTVEAAIQQYRLDNSGDLQKAMDRIQTHIQAVNNRLARAEEAYLQYQHQHKVYDIGPWVWPGTGETGMVGSVPIPTDKAFTKLPEEAMALRRLNREIRNQEQMYLQLQYRYDQLAWTKDSLSMNLRVVEQAVLPSSPFSPNKKMVLAMATFLGLFGGVAVALGIEHVKGRSGIGVA